MVSEWLTALSEFAVGWAKLLRKETFELSSVRLYGFIVTSPMFATVSPFFMEGTPHI
jgi:hypothetical protein